MSLLISTDTRLKSMPSGDIEGQYFESPEFGVFKVVSPATHRSIAIKNAYTENSFYVRATDIFEACLMVEV